MALIIPKNNADAQTLDATLKIYYDANDWVQNALLINKLSAALDALGIEKEKKEPQSYTKKTQVLAYYGFITWQDVTNSQSARRITDLGKEFYEARLSGDTDRVIEVLIKSLSTCTFGRNVIGCDSDSDIEAPNVFIKASLLLGGLNNNEFAFILGKMELSGSDFSDAIFQIKVNRLRDLKTYPSEDARKWSDPKPITALKNWGFFNSDDNTISNRVLLKYSDALINLRIKNTETVRFVSEQEVGKDDSKDMPLQQIFFGAPGSGKSFKLEEEILPKDDKLVFRTTFHPDTDYSSFVGCYKPQMKDGKIGYGFAPQVFTDAYVAAWNGLSENEKYYLVIEEINRGNCAQIFGDLFQLLDRKKETGYSEYSIKADNDLRDYLAHAKTENGGQVLINKEGIKDGKLCLPPNLNIIATMNTSDQSLFPMDSAFKRRWSWEYVPIKYDEPISAAFIINIPGSPFEKWVDFLKKINGIILEKTQSEDKQMGNFFIKGNVDSQEFKDKVMFYLWSEVCKDCYQSPENFFRAKIGDNTSEFSYNMLYDEKGDELLVGFLNYIVEYKLKEDKKE